jgi:hypothetical protein
MKSSLPAGRQLRRGKMWFIVALGASTLTSSGVFWSAYENCARCCKRRLPLNNGTTARARSSLIAREGGRQVFSYVQIHIYAGFIHKRLEGSPHPTRRHQFAAAAHPQTRISIHRCYKRYRGGAMRGCPRREILGVLGRDYAGFWIRTSENFYSTHSGE